MEVAVRKRIEIDGVLYEAVEGRTEIPVPTFRDIAVKRDVDEVRGKEITVFFDGLAEDDFLYAEVSFINRARSSRTPLEIDLNEIELPIDGYAITLRKGGSTNRSIKPFAILTYEDRDEAIRDYDRVVRYALTDLDIDLDDSRSAVRTLNRLAASIESKFGFTHV